jgi:hypothetical protein
VPRYQGQQRCKRPNLILPIASHLHLYSSIPILIMPGRRGSPVTCVVRLLHQLVSRVETVDMLATSSTTTTTSSNSHTAGGDIIVLLTRVLDMYDIRGLNKELIKVFAQQLYMYKCIYDCICLLLVNDLPQWSCPPPPVCA